MDKFEKLQKENKELRDLLNSQLPKKKERNRGCWYLINSLIENEIQQEELCEQ